MSNSNAEIFALIATQMMSGSHVEVGGERIPVRRSSAQHLKTVKFSVRGREYTGVEQNPEKPSRWGQLARAGRAVVQFIDNETHKFVAVCVDGRVKEFGSDPKG